MKLILYVFFLMAPTLSYGIFDSGIFPKEVKNECWYSWSKEYPNLLVGEFNVLISLLNTENKLEEKAYIYIDCRGEKSTAGTKSFDFSNLTTNCMGVKISHLDRNNLSTLNVLPIRPEQVEVKSKPSDNNLRLVWDSGSLFEIENGKSFSWTMKSSLSGRIFKGTTNCE